MPKRNITVLLTGGGTLGPVTPLLALAEYWKEHDANVEFVWAGTPNGPEKALVEKTGLEFQSIPVARIPRYLSLELLLFPFRFLSALFAAWRILRKEQPDIIASAGGFVSVPFVVLGRLLRIPSWIHQQDVPALLANKVMAPFASLITVTWESSLKDFPESKTLFLGNPVRRSILKGKNREAIEFFGLDPSKPTIFVLGGGGGSAWINEMMAEAGKDVLAHANVIHSTGKGKMFDRLHRIGKGYFATELITDELADAFAAADFIIARAGMGTITEISALRKASIIIPLPHSPQEKNAEKLKSAGAAVVMNQLSTTSGGFKKAVLDLLEDEHKQKQLAKNAADLFPTGVHKELVKNLEELAK